MSCARGCCDTQAAHYRSLSVAHPDRKAMTRTRTDDHGTHRVDVTEHYTDRQDVTVHAPRVAVRTATTTERD
jgi:hypothetical protein